MKYASQKFKLPFGKPYCKSNTIQNYRPTKIEKGFKNILRHVKGLGFEYFTIFSLLISNISWLLLTENGCSTKKGEF